MAAIFFMIGFVIIICGIIIDVVEYDTLYCTKYQHVPKCIVFIGMAIFIISFCILIANRNYKEYRTYNNPTIEDVNKGNASVDSIGVINNNVQYELNWIGDKTGKREQ